MANCYCHHALNEGLASLSICLIWQTQATLQLCFGLHAPPCTDISLSPLAPLKSVLMLAAGWVKLSESITGSICVQTHNMHNIAMSIEETVTIELSYMKLPLSFHLVISSVRASKVVDVCSCCRLLFPQPSLGACTAATWQWPPPTAGKAWPQLYCTAANV